MIVVKIGFYLQFGVCPVKPDISKHSNVVTRVHSSHLCDQISNKEPLLPNICDLICEKDNC